MGGFLSGIFWGGIVGIVALVASSFALDRQQLSFPKPEAGTVEVPGGSEFDQARPETQPVLPTTESRPEADPVAAVEAPAADDTPTALDTAALEVPEPTLEAPGGLAAAPEVSTDTQPEVATDSAPESTQGEALAQPETPGVAPSAEADDPVAPVAEASEDAAADVATSTVNDAAEAAETEIAALPDATTETAQPLTDTAPAVAPQADAPAAMAQPEIAEDSGLPASGAASDTTLGESPEAPRLPQVTSEPSLPESGSAPEVAEAPVVPSNPATDGSEGSESITVDGGPSALVPVEDLTDQATNVETNRLPQAGTGALPTIRRIGVGANDDPEPDVLSEAEEDMAEGEAIEPGGPALASFASTFENPEGTPFLSVVLIHTGPTVLSGDILGALPEHVSFAINAGSPSAAEIAKAYRDAGREVVLIPSLPAGATPQDVEQALRVNFETVPEAVALMDVEGASFQTDRTAVQQVVDVVAASGHGLITYPRGLNAAHQQAQRVGVPTGLIFRDLDSDDETPEQMRRTMDRAAFRARQNPGVILMGTTAATTLTTIVEWAIGNRTDSVKIAPVSATLSGE